MKHNAKIKDSDWEESMFSLGTYTGKNATGQKVHGSMNDYYKELSYGTFKVEGKFIGWVEVSKKRMEYSSRQRHEHEGEDRAPDRVAGRLHQEERQGLAQGLRRHLLPLRRRSREHDPRRALLAAPGQRRATTAARCRTSSCRRAAAA